MMYRNTIVVTFLLTVGALPDWTQEQRRSDGCNAESSQIENAPRQLTGLKWVQGPDGKRTPVVFTVRGMKIARLIFVGHPAAPLAVQEQIAKSLTERDYNDDRGALDELVERTRD